MGKLIATTQATVDGVVDPVGEWVQPDGDHGDYSFERQARSRGLVLGRKTFEGLAGYWPSQTGKWADMVNTLPKYVGSTTLSGDLEWNATLLEGAIEDSLTTLKNEVDGDLFVHGSGEFAYSLAEKGLIDEYEVYLNPLVWGQGNVHVLGDRGTVRLELDDMRRFDSGVVLLTYRPAAHERLRRELRPTAAGQETSMSKVWLVTGSSRGLGRALVEVALEAGDRVVATARSPERLQDLRDTYGEAVLALRLDVTDYDAAAGVVAQAEETFGRIDVVVNNAGYGDVGSFEDTSMDSFRAQIDTNFYGVVNVSKAVVPVLREQGGGHLFQVCSLSARLSGAGLTAYEAAKWAVAGFSSGLAKEVAPFGVNVTVLEPGGMRTDWAGSSMTIPTPSGPYQPVIGAFAELVRAGSGHEATDPRRVAQVVRDLAGRDDAPVRLLLGADAVPMAQQAAHDLAASDDAWREVSLSVSNDAEDDR